MLQNLVVESVPYSVTNSGVKAIDWQHRQISGQFGKLRQIAAELALHRLENQRPWEAFQYCLQDLAVLYLEHFRFEEELTQACRLPELAVHRQEHEVILRRVADCTNAMAVGMEVDLVAAAEFLASSFRQHEVNEDIACLKFFHQYDGT